MITLNLSIPRVSFLDVSALDLDVSLLIIAGIIVVMVMLVFMKI